MYLRWQEDGQLLDDCRKFPSVSTTAPSSLVESREEYHLKVNKEKQNMNKYILRTKIIQQ